MNSTRHHVPGVPCYSGPLFSVRIWSGKCCNSLEVLRLVSETKPISSGLVIRKTQMQHKATFSPHTNHIASDTTEKAGNPQLPSRSHFEWHELKMLVLLGIETILAFFKGPLWPPVRSVWLFEKWLMLAFAEKQCKNSLDNIFKLLKINLFSTTHMTPLEQRVADHGLKVLLVPMKMTFQMH